MGERPVRLAKDAFMTVSNEKSLKMAMARMLVLGTLASVALAGSATAQGTGVCTDSTNHRAWGYLHMYAGTVSSTVPAVVADRTAKGLPTLSYTQVKLVTDTAACRTASIAYDAQLETKRPNAQVIVIELGTKRVVIKDTGMHGRWLNMLFDQNYATLLQMIGL
jgi:hypothetical protein